MHQPGSQDTVERKMLRLSILSATLLFPAVTTDAFSVGPNKVQPQSSVLSLLATRRDVFENWTKGVTTVVAAATTIGVSNLQPANAEIDFNTVQDLLGSPENNQPQVYRPGGPRPTYLTEPTEEFKLNEQKTAEFKRKNILLKKQFTEALEKVTNDPNDGNTLANDLDTLRRLVRSNGGLPEGITKDEIIKICRRRKSKKFWPTDVEIAYQDLLLEIDYQQSPNTSRDKTFL